MRGSIPHPPPSEICTEIPILRISKYRSTTMQKRHASIRNANYHQTMSNFFSQGDDQNATLFFVGDLNYRLSCGRAHVYSLLQGRDISESTPLVTEMLQGLLLYDELLLQRSTGAAFSGFNEACINFYPTFKFDIGCNVYAC